jgi:hypothetical protein
MFAQLNTKDSKVDGSTYLSTTKCRECTVTLQTITFTVIIFFVAGHKLRL